MALLGDALRQAFMPKHEYESLREEEKAWQKLQRPAILFSLALVFITILVSTLVSLNIVFPADPLKRPFCNDIRIQPLPINLTSALSDSVVRPGTDAGIHGDSDLFLSAFVLTDQETVDYYWMVVFIPSTLVFAASVVYLVAGE